MVSPKKRTMIMAWGVAAVLLVGTATADEWSHNQTKPGGWDVLNNDVVGGFLSGPKVHKVQQQQAQQQRMQLRIIKHARKPFSSYALLPLVNNNLPD